MELRPEAFAILRVFLDNGCNEDDIIYFKDFGDAIVWEAGFIKKKETQSGLQEPTDGQLIIEYDAGLGIAAKGKNEIRNGY